MAVRKAVSGAFFLGAAGFFGFRGFRGFFGLGGAFTLGGAFGLNAAVRFDFFAATGGGVKPGAAGMGKVGLAILPHLRGLSEQRKKERDGNGGADPGFICHHAQESIVAISRVDYGNKGKACRFTQILEKVALITVDVLAAGTPDADVSQIGAAKRDG